MQLGSRGGSDVWVGRCTVGLPRLNTWRQRGLHPRCLLGQLVESLGTGMQATQRDVLRLAQVRLVEPAAPSAEGIPILDAPAPLLTCSEAAAGILEGKLACRLEPAEPGIRFGRDLHVLATSARLQHQDASPDGWCIPGHSASPNRSM